jgi:hypothetical protein
MEYVGVDFSFEGLAPNTVLATTKEYSTVLDRQSSRKKKKNTQFRLDALLFFLIISRFRIPVKAYYGSGAVPGTVEFRFFSSTEPGESFLVRIPLKS